MPCILRIGRDSDNQLSDRILICPQLKYKGIAMESGDVIHSVRFPSFGGVSLLVQSLDE